MPADRPLRADARRNQARVLDVAREVFAAEGLAVSIDEIARRAGVGVGTVYRHFPTLESLIPACAQATFAAGVRLPSTQEIAQQFSGLSTNGERLEHLIRDSCTCYERGESWLDACRREARAVPALADAVRTQDLALDALIEAAVGSQMARHRSAALKSLLDFPFWKSLVDAGVPRTEAPAIIADLALRLVEP